MSVHGKISDYYLPCPALTYDCGHKLLLDKSNVLRLSRAATWVVTNTILPLENGGGGSRRLLGGGIELQLPRRCECQDGAVDGTRVRSPWLDSNTTELCSKAVPVGH